MAFQARDEPEPPGPADTYNFRLDQHPSSYYVSRFQPQDIRTEANGAWVAIDAMADGPADLWFTVHFPISGGSVAKEHIHLAKEVLARIAELDAEARRLWEDRPDDAEEALTRVEIASEKISLQYDAGAYNGSWDVVVRRRGDGSWGPVAWT